MLIVYAKWNGTNRFHAFDLSEGVPVANIIYASTYRESEIDHAKDSLQRLCVDYKSINLTIQLRRDGKTVVWQSA